MPQTLTSEQAANASTGFQAAFKDGIGKAKKTWMLAAERVISTSDVEQYNFSDDASSMRKWVGPRQLHALKSYAWQIVNDVYENSLLVPVQDIRNDKLGKHANALRARGKKAQELWEILFYQALLNGFTAKAFDGKAFFAADHVMGKSTFSNLQTGSGEPWFLLCLDEGEKPFIMQVNGPEPELQVIDTIDAEFVIMNDKFFYGYRAAGAAGYKWPQLAAASKATLSEENLIALRKLMMKIKDSDGTPLNLKPTHLFVGPDNLSAAEKLINRGQIEGTDNELFHTLEIVSSGYITT